MTTRNDITGDTLQTKATTDKYRDGWDRIFGKKELDDNGGGEVGIPRPSRSVKRQPDEDGQHLSDSGE